MFSEKTSGQSLINDVGRKSTEEDFDGMDEINFNISSAVTSEAEYKGSPTKIGPGEWKIFMVCIRLICSVH